jgi:hypothetical protein
MELLTSAQQHQTETRAEPTAALKKKNFDGENKQQICLARKA